MFRVLPWSSCAVILLLLAAAPVSAQPFGIETRVPNTSLLIDAKPGGVGEQPVPDKLSDIPALLAVALGQDQTGAGIYLYKPSAELWSDGTVKSRYLALPGTSQMGYTESGGWNFPDGAVLIKNFRLPLDFRNPAATSIPLETRLIVKLDGDYNFYTYEWNDEGTDAALLGGSVTQEFDVIDADGVPAVFSWTYPSRSDCRSCHGSAPNFVLGMTTPQMNSSLTYPASGETANQLATFAHLGMFDAPLPAPVEELPASPAPFDENAGTLEERALSYLHANCSMCHQPGGAAWVGIDFRWGVPLMERELVGEDPIMGNFGVDGALRLKPGDPDRSLVIIRMHRRGDGQMPPLGTNIIHEDAVDLIREWILSTGEGETRHSADQNGNGTLDLGEVLRVIQLYNAEGLHCDAGTEDGYAPGAGDTATCEPHASDYVTQDWVVSLSELLRLIQLYNMGSFHPCDTGSEDGFCAAPA
jgi:uncharacterized repeat protein (TIGR03806 family)